MPAMQSVAHTFVRRDEQILKRVWFTGATLPVVGVGVCYDADSAAKAAATAEGRNRTLDVEIPTTSNNRNFAGVVQNLEGQTTGPAAIVIALPGGPAQILARASTTINVGRLTFQANGGLGAAATGSFQREGYAGRGSAIPLQTFTYVATATLIWAYLEDGEESGGVEEIQVVTGAAAQSMVGGVTYITGGVTIAGDSTATLADGTRLGERKGFYMIADLTTSNWVLTVTSGRKEVGGALANLTLDGAADSADLVWGLTAWRVLSLEGTVEA